MISSQIPMLIWYNQIKSLEILRNLNRKDNCVGKRGIKLSYTRAITETITWIGGDDRRISLFENAFPVPLGICCWMRRRCCSTRWTGRWQTSFLKIWPNGCREDRWITQLCAMWSRIMRPRSRSWYAAIRR